MVFSSYAFLFLYLPAFFVTYYLLRERFWNWHILLFSLFFYFAGEGHRVWILIVSIMINYGGGALIGWIYNDQPEINERQRKAARIVMLLGIAGNLTLLGYFKYIGFLTENLNALAETFGLGGVAIIRTALPLGISFFAFQGISYLIDVYRRTYEPTYSPVKFAAYKLMFPQLIAGPIVRYGHVAKAMNAREVSVSDAFEGLVRFCRGLAKKVLIADAMGQTADMMFALPYNEVAFGTAWLGVIAYTLQIYFDFSAYSDMAIGLGRMMGFRYPENFNYPYTATSIQDFWRRWHMTLSSWFRDYVYIPLGGNRGGPLRTYGNLLAVFMLTGLWHGAAWTFVAWGLWHGAFLMLERRFNPENWGVPRLVRHVYLLLVVMLGWLLFRAESFTQVLVFLKAMVGFAHPPALVLPLVSYLDPQIIGVVILGVAFSGPLRTRLMSAMPQPVYYPFGVATLGLLTIIACMRVLSGAYSPFLYFRF